MTSALYKDRILSNVTYYSMFENTDKGRVITKKGVKIKCNKMGYSLYFINTFPFLPIG